MARNSPRLSDPAAAPKTNKPAARNQLEKGGGTRDRYKRATEATALARQRTRGNPRAAISLRAQTRGATTPTARLRKSFPTATKSGGSRWYPQAGRMAPNNAIRKPESMKPAKGRPQSDGPE